MLSPDHLRDLTLRSPSAPDRPAFLSAASSLVRVQSNLYVVADDEHHLGVFPAQGLAKGRLVRLLEGDLPTGPKKRKRQKPDFEAQVFLPPSKALLSGALFALGSGSRPNRRSAVLLPLDETGDVLGRPRQVDLSDLLNAIAGEVDGLNIEGAIIVGEQLVLLQRGNKAGVNALISLKLRPILRALQGSDSLVAQPFSLQPVELGDIDGVAWGFTDASSLPDGRIVFTAVAEASKDTYLDGPCAGAALGILEANGKLERFERLDPTIKVEGVHAEVSGTVIDVLMVTDADDADIPAGLWAAKL